MNDFRLETERLILRPWIESDVEPFAALNADKEVMEYFPKLMTREETEAMVARVKARYAEDGFCFWATEEKKSGEFIGFVGLGRPSFEAHFIPCVEIGWRLARPYWGKGYAPEAAKEVLRDGFERCRLQEIVALTAVLNAKSRRVMEKISMHRDPTDDFMHPALDDGHPLKPHVLYRLSSKDWKQKK
ncbi:MAG: N-acetyltransferase [Cyanobacteria bacterium PR.3.49]|nr:N-acetyltransferase [Cyanobacteria bacterium PR.3.49]